MCHIVLVLPIVALPIFMIFPLVEASLYYGLILVACAILYWLMVKDMRMPASTGVEGMIGAIGRVIGNGARGIKVSLKGEIWDADCGEAVFEGEAVEVTGVERMRVIVQKRTPAAGRQRAMAIDPAAAGGNAQKDAGAHG